MSGCDHVVGLDAGHAGEDGGGLVEVLASEGVPADWPNKFCPDCGAPLTGEWSKDAPTTPGMYFWRAFGLDDSDRSEPIEVLFVRLTNGGKLFASNQPIAVGAEVNGWNGLWYSLPIAGPGGDCIPRNLLPAEKAS